MAEKVTDKSIEAYPMKGGDGLHSYANNSSYQRQTIDAAKRLIHEAVAEKLNIENLDTFGIADLGCSIGPNTFLAVQNIIEAIQFKYQSQGVLNTEFQVFFNDHSSNDFNTLFKSLPPDRQYYATGVPGSFYGRLFPNESMHFIHCSFGVHWLSKVPKEVMDKSSPAWNKGNIHYSNSVDEVVKAYEAQYAEDMQCFLLARAQEVVCGGLIALIINGRPNGTPHSQVSQKVFVDLLGSCLLDMARKGVVSAEKVDSFNVPVYLMSPQEFEAAVDRNGYFGLEKIEEFPVNRPSTELHTQYSITQATTSHMRAVFDGLITAQFGAEILNELFDSFRKKLEEEPSIFSSVKASDFFVLLKRKARD